VIVGARRKRPWQRRGVAGTLGVVFAMRLVPCLLFAVAWTTRAADERVATPGRVLAQQYCATCHLFPEPDTLPKAAWTNIIQPAMAKWLGLEKPDYDKMPGGELVRSAALFPTAPLLNSNDASAIWSYYAQAAPDLLTPAAPRPALHVGLKQFRPRKINPASGAPMISLVKIDPARRQLLAGDAFAGMFYTLDPTGGVLSRTRLGSAPVHFAATPNRNYMTLIGRLFPSDLAEGSVVSISTRADVPQPRPVLEKLHRPVQTIPADLDQDGREDLVVVSFGHQLGHFSWFENRGDGQFDEHVLLDRPGAVHAEVLDANGDGRPDIFVMMAQAREGIYLLLNEGRGHFALTPLVEKPPTWGFAGFDVGDFNRDGKIDILAVNGDNGDFALPPKPYHGLRIYLNDGTNRFQEAYFYPMPGAYRAVARDFNGDGDLDVAAIAFYPDFTAAAPENFVYLESIGAPSSRPARGATQAAHAEPELGAPPALRFLPHTLAESADGRWMTLDAGDLDGDGDIDLALGSFVRGPTTQPVPAALEARWRTNGAAVLLLENLRK
jgi:hypothetical protein